MVTYRQRQRAMSRGRFISRGRARRGTRRPRNQRRTMARFQYRRQQGRRLISWSQGRQAARAPYIKTYNKLPKDIKNYIDSFLK